jgi:putative ATPase
VDLFQYRARKDPAHQPLAERMRPRSLEEFVGQRHLVAPGRMLARALDEGDLPSLVLWGPPGTGKTTLARLLAARIGARFEQVSAVAAGIKEVREVVAAAERSIGEAGRRTVLFLDEIHRFNKAQQDALLPAVESGLVTLVGATTENPSFEVNAALLSRCRVVRLDPLADADVRALVDRALTDGERGLGAAPIDMDEGTRDLLARAAEGDARRALTTLEVAAHVAPLSGGRRRIDAAVVEEALQSKTLLYDRAGEEHYNIASAFIKSMRASDPDAAVYWMMRMLEAGEEPRFLLRRMVIFAGEDVGLADPRALQVAVAALQAFELIGMPEGIFPLTEAALYLATAPKSNSALTTSSAARDAVRAHGALPVPMHLRNAPTKLMKEMGYGEGYEYAHDAPEGFSHANNLPEKIAAERFYAPRDAGYEKQIAERVKWFAERRREKKDDGQ